MNTEHARLSARLRHPSGGASLWTALELSAPVEAIWMIELAAQLREVPDSE